jgi:hypothetical protein
MVEFFEFWWQCFRAGWGIADGILNVIGTAALLVSSSLLWRKRYERRKKWEDIVLKTAGFFFVVFFFISTFFVAPFLKYDNQKSAFVQATNQIDLLENENLPDAWSNKIEAANENAIYWHSNSDQYQEWWLDALASTNSSATSETLQSLIDEERKEQADDTNNESYSDELGKGRIIGRLQQLEWIEQQKEGIQNVYYLWNYSVSALQTSLMEIAKKYTTNNCTITPFPDLDSASKAIAAGPFSGDIASDLSHGWNCTYDGRGIPEPQLTIQWNGRPSKSWRIVVGCSGEAFHASLTIDGTPIEDNPCALSDKKACLHNVNKILNIIKQGQAEDMQ